MDLKWFVTAMSGIKLFIQHWLSAMVFIHHFSLNFLLFYSIQSLRNVHEGQNLCVTIISQWLYVPRCIDDQTLTNKRSVLRVPFTSEMNSLKILRPLCLVSIGVRSDWCSQLNFLKYCVTYIGEFHLKNRSEMLLTNVVQIVLMCS